MSSFLSRLHADLRSSRLTKRGAAHLPKDVPTGAHKAYPRMPQIFLPEPARLPDTLQETLENRRSARSGNPDMPMSLQETGTLLGLGLAKKRGSVRRNYPSGGALYPVETYVVSTALESQPPAAFHYNPTRHTLERLWVLPDAFNMKSLAKHPDTLPVSTLIVFTSVWQRSSAKYGDLAYQHALIESGHMSENLLLLGSALSLHVRPYAGFNDKLLAQLLDLDEECEQPVHAVTLCKGDGPMPEGEVILD